MQTVSAVSSPVLLSQFFSTSTPFPVLAVLFHRGSPFCCPPSSPRPPPPPHRCRSFTTAELSAQRGADDQWLWELRACSDVTVYLGEQMNFLLTAHTFAWDWCALLRIGYITWHSRYQHYPTACFRCSVKSSRTVPESWHLQGAVKKSDPDKDPDPAFNKVLRLREIIFMTIRFHLQIHWCFFFHASLQSTGISTNCWY